MGRKRKPPSDDPEVQKAREYARKRYERQKAQRARRGRMSPYKERLYTEQREKELAEALKNLT